MDRRRRVGALPRSDPHATTVERGRTGQPLLRPVLPQRRSRSARDPGPRAHGAGPQRHTPGTREGLSRSQAPRALLLTDDGARRRHCPAQRRQYAQRAAHAGQLCPAERTGGSQRAAGAGVHLLHQWQPTRSVLFQAPGANGLRCGRAAEARPGEPGPDRVPRPRRLAGRDGTGAGHVVGRSARPGRATSIAGALRLGASIDRIGGGTTARAGAAEAHPGIGGGRTRRRHVVRWRVVGKDVAPGIAALQRGL